MDTEKYDKFVKEMYFAPKTKEYLAIALGGEVGEVLNEVKKEIRDRDDRNDNILHELGDSLYYLVGLGHWYGFSLSDIIAANIRKLEARHKAPVQGAK